MALVAAALALAASAQQPDQFVMHLYVDPIYGNDPGPLGVNEFFNPDGTGPECTAQTVVGPHSVQLAGPGSGTAPLFHAPYPFKTITAAIAYVTRLSPGAQPLPHTDPTTGLTWSHCIIHLLPGWYGRSSANIFNNSRDPFTGTHKASRLVPNGETFPLHIPPRVSLAGTSALNTILDLGMVGTAIEFGKVVSGIALSGEETFIDKITFYACGGWQPTVPAPEPDPRKCAAILIDDEMRCGVTITNCVFLKNVLGVLVNAPPGTHNDFYAATTGLNTCPTIINCTFTFNMIGIWNGQLASQSSVGVTPLNLVNNIFDASETVSGNSGNATWPCENLRVRQFNPSWPAFLPLHLGNPTAGTTATPITTIQTTTGIISDFEGISQADLRTVVGTTPVDFNAYELGVAIPPQIPLRPFAYNLGLPMGSAFCTLPVTRPRLNPYGNPNNTTFNPDPARDIGPITGWLGNSLGNARGVLYISDLICHGRVPQTVNGVTFAPFPPDWNDRTYDGSLHDVRLSPIASLAPIPPSGQTSAPAFDNLTGLLLNRLPNPLVDTGYSGPFPAQMENGFAIPRIPGTLSLNAASQVTWQHNCWEADCEGYGNPRIHDHPDYVLTPNPAEGGIDVGADEVGELIVAGYRFGTTSFLGLPVNHPDNTGPSSTVAVDNTNLYYLGPPDGMAGAIPRNTISQPDYRLLVGYSAGDSSVYPSSYIIQGLASGMTWHSAEDIPSLLNASNARPYFALRNQTPGAARAQPAAIAPPALALTGTFIFDLGTAVLNLGNACRATSADITPALLPDIHPWWLDAMPELFFIQAQTMSPLFALWQNPAFCTNYLTTQTAGVANLFNANLYAVPSSADINPPGSGTGFTDIQGNGTYQWLDGTPNVIGTTPPFSAKFEAWNPTPLAIAGFDGWCRPNAVTPIQINRAVALPSTKWRVDSQGTPNPLPEAACLRFTLEWSDAESIWQLLPGTTRQKNMQSFQVLVKTITDP